MTFASDRVARRASMDPGLVWAIYDNPTGRPEDHSGSGQDYTHDAHCYLPQVDSLEDVEPVKPLQFRRTQDAVEELCEIFADPRSANRLWRIAP
jgi:hypothetical protein